MAAKHPILEPFAEHLKFLGYQIVEDELGVQALHPAKPQFRFYWSLDGVGFLAPFVITKAMAEDKPGFLDFLNRLNSLTILCKYYLAYNKYFVLACYPVEYEREGFGRFFDTFMRGIDTPHLLAPLQADYNRYFLTGH